MNNLFKVIDITTGQEADQELIALKEEWAKGLIYCDMNGFAILEDGLLILTDECGSFKHCPENRFKIVWLNDILIDSTVAQIIKLTGQVEKNTQNMIGLVDKKQKQKGEKIWKTVMKRLWPR